MEKYFRRAALFCTVLGLMLDGLWAVVIRPAYGPLHAWWALIWLVVPALYILYLTLRA